MTFMPVCLLSEQQIIEQDKDKCLIWGSELAMSVMTYYLLRDSTVGVRRAKCSIKFKDAHKNKCSDMTTMLVQYKS